MKSVRMSIPVSVSLSISISAPDLLRCLEGREPRQMEKLHARLFRASPAPALARRLCCPVCDVRRASDVGDASSSLRRLAREAE